MLAGTAIAGMTVRLASSIDSFHLLSELKSMDFVKLILETSAYGLIVKGFLVGLPVLIVGLVAICHAFRNYDRRSIP